MHSCQIEGAKVVVVPTCACDVVFGSLTAEVSWLHFDLKGTGIDMLVFFNP
jgi:hypothetical protein